jgi:hypothetical protein
MGIYRLSIVGIHEPLKTVGLGVIVGGYLVTLL